MLIVEFMSGVALTFMVLWLTWWMVEMNDYIPAFLQFKPYNCRTCLTFWLTIGIAVGWWLVGMHGISVTMGVLAVLNAVAMIKDDKEKFDE